MALKNALANLSAVEATWAQLCSNVNLQNAHQGGQIVLIRKLQGNWDSSKGDFVIFMD